MRNIAVSSFIGALLLCVPGLRADTAETIPFLALMQAGNEVPAITDTSNGNAIIWVHVVRDGTGAITSGSVDFDISTKFTSAVTVTGLHIHSGVAGIAGSIVIPTDVNASDKSIAIDSTGRARVLNQVQFPQTPAIALATIVDLLKNPQNYYVNMHTTVNPAGAMRGQLLAADQKVLMGMMSPQNEIPPVPLTASGIASVTLLRGRDPSGNVAAAEAIFNLEYTGFDPGTIFSGFHIHNGTSTVNGGVVINTGIGGGASSVAADPTGAGNLNYLVPMSPLDSTFATEVGTVNGLFSTPSNHYINIHTTVYPSGVMRDQMRNTEKSVFQVNMLPANEVPAIAGLAANGTTSIPIYLLRNADGSVAAGTVVFDVNYRGFPASTTITGLHVHQQAAGFSGPIVFPSGVDAGANKVVTDIGNGNIFKTLTVATPAGITALNQLIQNPAGFYSNLHTVNPGGAMRSQLQATVAAPALAGAAATASTVTSAAPGSILSIYGNNLSAYTSDLSGFSPAQMKALPLTMNGVSATIGGVKMPFYFISPGQLNVQVPFEAIAGSQQVVVTTPSGVSTPLNVTVASLAPSIFLVDAANTGAILKNNDFSLVTSTNPAKAGDVLLVYSTGLGQTTPAAQTAVLLQPPATGFNNTATVTVSIGGKSAPVIYSIATPGSAGLYQTAVTVPTGLTGTVPLILTIGTAPSNTVSMAVQ